MDATAPLTRPKAARRPVLGGPLLRLRSDEQLVQLFRDGSEEAFTVIHDRYRQRLFAYVRQMLATGPKSDAEDVLQDVFVRAYGALRGDTREVHLKAWLYRVAHNRCIDHLRRPTPPEREIFELSRTPLQDPFETAQRRDDLKQLVEDVGRLPEQQRSALLMREIDGLAYADIAAALDVTVPAVKSLLVRARVGLVEAIQARDTDCSVIRADLLDAYDRGVKASARAKKHMRECSDCREYKTALRSMKASFAALTPAIGGIGLAAAALKAIGVGGSSGGGAAAIAGGGTAAKVCAVVCGAAIATGGAVEVHHLTQPKEHQQTQQRKQDRVTQAAPAPAAPAQPAPAATQAPADVPPVAAPTEAPVQPVPEEEPAAAPTTDPVPTPTATPEASVTPAPTATATPATDAQSSATTPTLPGYNPDPYVPRP